MHISKCTNYQSGVALRPAPIYLVLPFCLSTKDGDCLKMVVDDRALNKLTVKNGLPRIDDLLDSF